MSTVLAVLALAIQAEPAIKAYIDLAKLSSDITDEELARLKLDTNNDIAALADTIQQLRST